jgi:hypothetical protein
MSLELEQLETNAEGMVVTRPLLGWVTAPAMGMSVILRLNYAERPADIRTGGQWLQTVMTPQQALDLAEILTKQARRVFDSPQPQRLPN